MKWYDMPETDYRASRLCRILGNPKTYALIKTLEKFKKATPSQLAKVLNRKISTISIHLRNLRNIDVVCYQKIAHDSIYWLKSKKVNLVLKTIESYVEYLRKKR